MKKLLRRFARALSFATQKMPVVHRVLKTSFLSLPVGLRGRQMIWDTLKAVGAGGGSLSVLQVGANDGDFNDPVAHFIRKYGWSGLLVEPVPSIFERLSQNYKGVPGIRLANVAISDHDGVQDFYYLDTSRGNLPVWCVGVGSFLREEVERACPPPHRVEDHLRCITVPCRTLPSLLQEQGLRHPDVVVIDAEGYDARILLQLEMEVPKPRVIIYEHHLLPAAERAECDDFLRRHGYTLEADRWDTLALQPVS